MQDGGSTGHTSNGPVGDIEGVSVVGAGVSLSQGPHRPRPGTIDGAKLLGKHTSQVSPEDSRSMQYSMESSPSPQGTISSSQTFEGNPEGEYVG